MRQRRINNQEERLEALLKTGVVIEELEGCRGNWLDIFDCNGAGLFLEIGCGKGRFIVEKARRNPDDCFLAAEIQSSAIVLSGEKHDEDRNLKFIYKKIDEPDEVFAEDELDGIFLNFSDPWPKKRHTKRRLTSEKFLKAYSVILREGGFIEMKTDNKGLYEFTCQEIERLGHELGLDIEASSRDLHKSKYSKGNIITEYERKFIDKDEKIYYMLIRKRG